jgi:predicted PurR-regulated permease PerM
METERRSRLAFWVLGALLGAVVVYTVHRFVGTFVFGLFIYYATRPVYRRVRRRIRPDSLAAGLSLFLLALPALLLGGYALAIAFQQLDRFATSRDLGPLQTYLAPYFDVTEIVRNPSQLLSGDAASVIQQFLTEASTLVGFFGIMAIHLFLMLAIAFYLLRDDQRLARWFEMRFCDANGVVESYVRSVDRDLHSVFFGNILNAVLTGSIGAITYSLLNLVSPAGMSVPYAALLGLLTGVASLVPIVGMKLVYVPVAAWLFSVPVLEGLTGVWWFPVAFVLLSFVVVDTIPDLVLRPYVSGRSLHVGTLMIAYVVGPLLFGWYGIFLAPLLLVLAVQFGRIVLPELVASKPIKPYAVDPGSVVDPAPPFDPDDDE